VDKGYNLLKAASEKLPDVADVTYHFAVAKYKKGEKAEAQQMLKELLDSGKEFLGKKEAEKFFATLQ
ncbi:MAG: hypothetical protein FD130_1132, partial [Halothiobacillaceae bacterium]